MISCIQRGCADHCTTSVDADTSLCMVLVCLLRLSCIVGRTSPCGWCQTSGAGPAAPPAPAMASPAWAFRVTWSPLARTQKSEHSGSPVTGLGAAAISACGTDASSESDCRHTPFKTGMMPLQNRIKTICEPAGRFLKYLKPLLHLKR